jgi:DNA replication and repair protein RecF
VRLRRLVARGFRNLDDLDVELPPGGVALLGANAQGKTNLLEAAYYPVLFRSLRGSADQDVARYGGTGFHLEVHVEGGGPREVSATWTASGRRKRIAVDGTESPRVADVAGAWLAVAFLPADVELAAGPASERRRFLDRMLSLADRQYLRALVRYRAALAQRNSALRQGKVELARAFDGPLSEAGAFVVRTRERWVGSAADAFAAELESLGESSTVRLTYRGDQGLADPACWASALDTALARDRARGMTTVGPHRDDLVIELGGRALRASGSTGQQRSAAVALKLVELVSLRSARGTEPALLLDDVFAELDRDRQRRLARRVLGDDGRQVFVTAPRPDELPPEADVPVWTIEAGRVIR